ncbi:DUF5458 family protein [uncultured Maribacter sp.]|uniref:DUF5458 family protein n=1 Tax=uncultured Maribacter sp. TaxID=431308 RepID=UPI00262804E5|nr:DUF5458 family protein [uncultured Maribacter sp.]
MANTSNAAKQEAVQDVQVAKKSNESLVKYGGFDLVEATIDGSQNMNPERKARKKIFLTESSKSQERKTVKKTLEIWSSILNGSDDISEMIENAEKQSKIANETLDKNVGKALEETRDLERSYRSMALFYKNAEEEKIRNITIVNAELDQIKDLDNTSFTDAVTAELRDSFDRLDLRDNYGLLVIPGYLGSNAVVEKWAKIAYDNKVMLVTDFEHLDEPDDVLEMFEAAKLTGSENHRSNIMMTCNWLKGRDRFSDVGEQDDLYVPPAGALAGKMYQTLMSQVTAGKKYGGMSEVSGVRFDLRKSEITNLEKVGLVPMVDEYGKVMAFSAKTLFNGDNLGLQTYSVVRVFDYVTKVLMDFLNRRAFENFNARTRSELNSQIVKFLDKISGPGKLIEDFTIKRFEQDPNQKDRIHLDIHMKPYFPAKNFLIKLDGQKGDDGNDWEAEYEQQ